ncbi:twin-arginine translocation signal domain-containing protein [Rhizobium leguminosarum]
MQVIQNRRRFLAGLSAGAAAGLLGAPQSLHAESPLETTRIRLAKIPSICVAPQYVAEELLRAEGFTEIAYVVTGAGAAQASAVANGEIDFTLNFVTNLIVALDSGARITLLAPQYVAEELIIARGTDWRLFSELKRELKT